MGYVLDSSYGYGNGNCFDTNLHELQDVRMFAGAIAWHLGIIYIYLASVKV